MAEKALDIPVADLPFEAGNGFFATVSEDGIAHITISVAETKTQAEKAVSERDGNAFSTKWGGSLGDWAKENAGVFKGVEKHAKEDPILEAILEKHAPELLG